MEKDKKNKKKHQVRNLSDSQLKKVAGGVFNFAENGRKELNRFPASGNVEAGDKAERFDFGQK